MAKASVRGSALDAIGHLASHSHSLSFVTLSAFYYRVISVAIPPAVGRVAGTDLSVHIVGLAHFATFQLALF